MNTESVGMTVETIEIGIVRAVPTGSIFLKWPFNEQDSRVFFKISDDEMYIFSVVYDRPSEKHIVRKRKRTINKCAWTKFTCVSVSEEDIFHAQLSEDWGSICRQANEHRNRINCRHVDSMEVDKLEV